MSGPVSYPMGNKSKWDELNEIVCNNHFHCGMEKVDKHGNEVKHDYITCREWLARRNKLRTGKTA